ncbi:MAG: DUF2975 domain-containing protein [Pseudomonadota bacterium]
MRALGPGSVSSFLKTILDVAYFALLAFSGLLLLLGLAGVLLSFDQDLLARYAARLQIDGDAPEPGRLLPMLGAGFAYLLVSTGGVLAIVSRLRMVFRTLTAGDPFHPDNVGRLRLIGFVLAGLEVARHLAEAAFARLGAVGDGREEGVNVTAWFAVLVIFVLAEVFREGARLRREAELTI